MKTALLLLIFSLPLSAEDWTTIDGKTYNDVTVVKVETDAVTILDKNGGALVPLCKLPATLQARFHYDPVKAKVAADARIKAVADSEKAMELEREQLADKIQSQAQSQATVAPAQPAWGRIIQVLPDGVLSTITTKGVISDHPCFVVCDTTGLVDGLWWRSRIVPAGTYSYTDTDGAKATVLKFEGDMIQAVKVPQVNPLTPPAGGLEGAGL